MENPQKLKCRACLSESVNLKSLYDKWETKENTLFLAEIFILCTSLKVEQDSEISNQICTVCIDQLTKYYNFRIQCETSDYILNKELDTAKQHSQNQSNNIVSSEDENDNEFGSKPADISDNPTPLDEENKPAKSCFECMQCSSTFDTKKKLTEHFKTHMEFSCKECNVKFTKASLLRKHQRYYHQIFPVERRTCQLCGKILKNRASMLKHMRKHSAPPKSCRYCEEVPATPALLAKHMESMHAEHKTISCAECGKTFFKKSNLRMHMTVHSGVKKFTCEICGISFTLSGNLASHRRIHTGEKPYTCSHCGRGFIQQASLRSHEAGHTNIKTHTCSECGASFSRAGGLRNHMKRHQADRPFVCDMCGKAFTFSAERKRHMTVHTGLRNYVCDVCGKRFNRTHNLNVHARIHSGETPHVCHICNKGFRQIHCLKTHMNSHTTDNNA